MAGQYVLAFILLQLERKHRGQIRDTVSGQHLEKYRRIC
jgi:hypothetical protein